MTLVDTVFIFVPFVLTISPLSAVIIEEILCHLESTVTASLADVTNIKEYIAGLKNTTGKIRFVDQIRGTALPIHENT